MSKKKTRVSQSRGDSRSGAGLTLDTLRDELVRLRSAQDFDALLSLSRKPLQSFAPGERKRAQALLAECALEGLCAGNSVFSMPAGAKRAAREVLEELRAHCDDFYSAKFVKTYCELLQLEPATVREADLVSKEWFARAPSIDSFELLRARALRAAFAHECAESDGLKLLRQRHGFDNPTADLLAATSQLVALDLSVKEDQVARDVYVAESMLLVPDARPSDELRRYIEGLGGPAELALARYVKDSDFPEARLTLTPASWYFLWAWPRTPASQWRALCDSYAEDFGSPIAQAHLALLRAVLATDEAAGATGALWTQACDLIAQCAQKFYPTDAMSLAVRHSTGGVVIRLDEAPLAGLSPDFADLDDLAQAQGLSPEMASILGCLAQFMSAVCWATPLEFQDDAQTLEHLDELSKCSAHLSLALSERLPYRAPSLILFVRAIRLSTVLPEVELAWPPSWMWESLEDEDAPQQLSAAEVSLLLDELDLLAESRHLLTPRNKDIWQEGFSAVYEALSESKHHRSRCLQTYLSFPHELIASSSKASLGFAQQAKGNNLEALRLYLEDLVDDDVEDGRSTYADEILRMAPAMWRDCPDVGSIREMLELTDSFERSPADKGAREVAQLRQGLAATLKEREHRDDFERTAVDRWPGISAPARKLLSVLSSLRSLASDRELAMFAGMEPTWVGRHLSKLESSGMFSVVGKAYRINPHIKPLLDLEATHSVAGRIVRSQGTNAVKQVFNSQREFDIYRILVQLCPNHLVFPNCSLQSIMDYDKLKGLVDSDTFGYFLRASVDVVVVSSTTHLPLLAIEVDSVWHDTQRQLGKDEKKDRLFSVSGIPFLRLRPHGSPSESVIRGQVAAHLEELVRSSRDETPGHEQVVNLLKRLSATDEREDGAQAPKN